MFYKVMDGIFDHDGLASSWTAHVATSENDAWQWLADKVKQDTNHIVCWVEVHTDRDKDSAIWVQEPYPQRLKSEMPNWYLEMCRAL